MVEQGDPSRSSNTAQCRIPESRRSTTTNGFSPRVLVVSDICVLREGLVLLLSGSLDMGGAAEPADAPAIVAAQHPDVVLLDAGAVGGRGMPRLLKALSPDLRVVVFALADGEAGIVGWAEAGASGYVARDGNADDLIAAVDGAMRGEVFCSPKLAGLLFARVAELAGDTALAQVAGGLTPREQEIMALVDEGLGNKEIARRLGIENSTVKNHVHRILAKMQVHGRGEAAARRRRGEDTAPQQTRDTPRRLTPR